MTIGWYVHHHGAGHLHRFLAVRDVVGERVVGLGGGERPAGVEGDAWVALPSDVPDGPAEDPTAGGALHWAPLRAPDAGRRAARIAQWVDRERPRAIVVDVSVEVAVLARLLSVPTVVVAQRGVRRDVPHRTGYATASAVVAPWTAATHDPADLPAGVAPVLCGAVSRFDGRVPPPAPAPGPDGAPRDVLLLVGSGGHALRADDVVAAAAATPGTRWHVAGALRTGDAPGVVDHGPRADVWDLLGRCGVAVGTAGGNVVAEVAAARRPLVLLPQDRPFDEQHRQAALLARAGLAATHAAWPAAAAWPGVLRDAVRRGDAAWTTHHDGHAAERIAAVVRRVAHGGRVDADDAPAPAPVAAP